MVPLRSDATGGLPVAKRRGFFAELQHQAKVAEQQRIRAANAAQREHAAAVRKQEAAAKKAEAARAKALRAAQADAKRADAEAKRLHQEARQAEVDQLNAELASTYEAIDSVLSATLEVDDFIDLATLRAIVDHPPFPHPELEVPIPAPEPVPTPAEPTWSEPAPPTGLQAVVGKKKHRAEREATWAAFQARYQQWQQMAAAVPAQQLAQIQDHQRAEAERLARLQAARAEYVAECEQRERNIAAANDELDALIAGLESGQAEMVDEYVSIVLANSVYPTQIRVDHDYSFDATLKELTLTVVAPAPSDLPTAKSYRYVKGEDAIIASDLSQKAQKDRYNGLIHQIALRTPHEIFEADRHGHVETISMTVQTSTVDPATGQDVTVPLVALATDRPTFEAIELAKVEPAATLGHLGALVSKNPHGLVAIDTSKGVRG